MWFQGILQTRRVRYLCRSVSFVCTECSTPTSLPRQRNTAADSSQAAGQERVCCMVNKSGRCRQAYVKRRMSDSFIQPMLGCTGFEHHHHHHHQYHHHHLLWRTSMQSAAASSVCCAGLVASNADLARLTAALSCCAVLCCAVLPYVGGPYAFSGSGMELWLICTCFGFGYVLQQYVLHSRPSQMRWWVHVNGFFV